jgi:hypothetical protein
MTRNPAPSWRNNSERRGEAEARINGGIFIEAMGGAISSLFQAATVLWSAP